jgi:hypothetical protein
MLTPRRSPSSNVFPENLHSATEWYPDPNGPEPLIAPPLGVANPNRVANLKNTELVGFAIEKAGRLLLAPGYGMVIGSQRVSAIGQVSGCTNLKPTGRQPLIDHWPSAAPIPSIDPPRRSITGTSSSGNRLALADTKPLISEHLHLSC